LVCPARSTYLWRGRKPWSCHGYRMETDLEKAFGASGVDSRPYRRPGTGWKACATKVCIIYG